MTNRPVWPVPTALMLSAAVTSSFAPPASADPGDPQTITLPALIVTGERDRYPRSQIVLPEAPDVTPSADGGDFLRSVPGVSGSRMGGHGIDPVIRGQQGTQLTILNDGASVHGGCPNRMDPPSAFAAPETFDQVIVTHGYQTVTGGTGRTGGTVEFRRLPPDLTADKPYAVRAGGGYETNGNGRDSFVDGAVGADGFYARAIGRWKKADNYEDGAGNRVRSSFTERSGDLSIGYAGDSGVEGRIGLAYERVDDALFEGANMDSPYSEDLTLKGNFSIPMDGAGPLRGFRGKVFASWVDHRMDNFSLRTRVAPMAMRVASESDTYGGEVAADLAFGNHQFTVGVSYQQNNREATRYGGMSNSSVSTINALMWPEAKIAAFGLFAEDVIGLDGVGRLIVGLRYDRDDSSAGRANETVLSKGRSPNDLYARYYGKTADGHDQNNVGGLVRFERDLPFGTVHLGVSRSIRVADATERYIASDSGPSSWVGNPALSAEKHHQAEVGIVRDYPDTAKKQGVSLSATAYVDYVDDYILRDTARGQAGILQADGATIYRNVDAMLAGFTASVGYGFAGGWHVQGDLAYVYGQDRDADHALAQIPPLEGSVALTHRWDDLTVGSRLRGALKQGRVDTNPLTGTGRDVRKTPGWLVQDIFASYLVVDAVDLRAGVTNLFDRNYAQHLNRSNAFDPNEVQVNEPGRSFYLRLTAAF